jgi:hypothetical protein
MSPVSRPVLLLVLAHMPTEWRHCSHCERLFEAADIGEQVRREMRAGYPPEILEQAGRLATWLQDLSIRYGQDLQIRVVDPQSLEGFALSLRYWVRRYPTFILNGRTITGRNQAALERLLTDQISQATHSGSEHQRWAVCWRKRVDQLRRAWRALGEIFYGMTTFDWVRDLRRTRSEVERLFVLVAFGDVIGLPILPPYYTLRLLPYIVPALDRWKRNLLRERDWTDLTELIEGID